MTNINPNNDIGKINHNIKKGNKVNKQETPVSETKSVEASSLYALSAYGKANINFKGKTILSVKTKNDEISEAEITSSIGEAEETEEYKSTQYEESKDITSITSSETMFTPDVKTDIETKLKTMLDSEDEINEILNSITEENLPIVQKLLEGDGKKLKELHEYFNENPTHKFLFKSQMYSIKKEPVKLNEILNLTKKDNLKLANRILFDKNFTQKELILSVLKNTNKSNADFIEEIMFDDNFKNKKEALNLIEKINDENLNFTKKLYYSGSLEKNQIADNIQWINKGNEKLLSEIFFGKDKNGKDFLSDKQYFGILGYFYYSKPFNEFIDKLYRSNDFPCELFPDKKEIKNIIKKITGKDLSFAEELYIGKNRFGKDIFKDKNLINDILLQTNSQNLELAKKLCLGRKGKDIFTDKSLISDILSQTNNQNIELATRLCFGKNGKDTFHNKRLISDILSQTNNQNIELATRLCFGKNGKDTFPKKSLISDILAKTNSENIEFVKRLCFGNLINNEEILSNQKIFDELIELVKSLQNKEISENVFRTIIQKDITLKEFESTIRAMNKIDSEQLSTEKLANINNRNKLNNISRDDLLFYIKNIKLYKKSNINELSTTEKNFILKNLIKRNTDLFNISDELKQDFPLIPKNPAEYCSLLKGLVKSMGIQTNEITTEQEKQFDKASQLLAYSLSNISDKDFVNLSISQEYPKEDFIQDILKTTKKLNKLELEKVYDYFGFELKKSDNTSTGYTIIGYPINLNNGVKLAQIEEEETKEIIEQLRPYIIKFSENNKISCDNKDIENALNEIASVLPEIRTFIGKIQHKTQHYDIMKHSLKVMQKIVQNPSFENLNKRDKKIMLLASLLHDSAKSEGNTDAIHAKESSFDAFYISQKFNLTKDERIKLYSLIEHHEWLAEINKEKNPDLRLKKLKSKAYDLHYDNLFELSKIFTEADLKAVKIDDRFFDRFKNDFNIISEQVESLISTLKNSQPLLPVTPIPSASRIKEAITVINDDYSTNLKGIYVNEKGLVIIKYNEVENDTWEKIGFPKGSISKGIEQTVKVFDHKNEKTKKTVYKDENINTGNIHFFVHGLEYANQLSNFDTFTLPDSDALLSVSYAERPESKYRFYRTQGVILNTDAKYVHGGGKTDMGSGCGKNIDEFKKNYAYEGSVRHSDRTFVSDLIKKDLDLSNEEYLNLIKKYKNKPFSEIQPKELQEKIIKALAKINSHIRKGDRSYNEMYISNPDVMGYFAYDCDDKVGKIKPFINNAKKVKPFIKENAIEKDVPLIVFGD